MRTAAVLRVDSSMRLDLSASSVPNARSIAISSLEYRFCSDIGLSVEKKVPSFGLLYIEAGSTAAVLTPTRPFRAELLIAIRIL